MWRIFLLLIFLAGHAQAGAWLRPEGAGFLSFSTHLKKPETLTDPAMYSAIYAEYGAKPRLTLGIDAGYDDLGQYKAFAFLVRPIERRGDTWRLSYELGLGAINSDLALRPGLAIGRGFAIGETPGWVSVESRAEIVPGDGAVTLATDVTLGLSPWDRSKLILQLQAGGTLESPPWLRIAPSYVRRMKKGRHLEIGVTAGLSNAESFGVKFGVWREF
ncbi:hypothetical protein K1T73_12420 [Roseovarius sp. SCSIO 43702]|uniref:hypothetical protein n=1 Tax=Roseovarius sp. SCSIO 43702 TaxID=2823043 RepID=UPI001C72AA2A|nr:hypothetical protein [Roseovarius sp. SCSIO 43702]QYX55872.1 hypothetical protein K1T73_12420 [Roseovarius sp. SCSIO 43702]